MTTFATPGPIAATVQVAGARVRVNATDRDDTVVTVEPVDPASRFDVKVAEKTKVAFAGGRLSVKTTASGRKGASVAITIDLPAHSSLVAYLGHSTVDAEGSFGECELHTASSTVTLEEVAALQANFGSGELAVGRVAGRTSIDGGRVAVRIGEAGGPVRLANSGGRVWIGRAAADLDLTSGHGAFDVDRADAGVSVQTGDGAIRVGRITRGRAKLWNGSGDIEIGIGEGSGAQVHAESKKGSVRNDIAAQDDSERVGEQVTVDARTRFGDIVIRRTAN
ncbi:DUF4097 family beta strand repeat-containing protein [Glycomyces harbinensis]|uniref:Putative adhesin n=1 Tax=Glycomyces harbinensis TaxID=58114 RepID=A0A1G6W097_9ACTN|nr:DUF4097 family beta strand repeat-containing protein [Glycomyces harbinensis]SDD59228.1 Putative adhesin [Glycomyces harbinensis]